VDDLLRNHVFVDLYRVVSQSLLVGEPAYSLKNIERLYRRKRAGDVATAGESMVFFQKWLIERDGEDWRTSRILRDIRDYNEEDCRSTAELAAWLRARQKESGIRYEPPAEPPPGPREEVTERKRLAESLLADLPEDPGEARLRQMLGWLLEFHRREQKPAWWRRFDWQAKTTEELIEDPDCLGGLRRTAKPPFPIKRSHGYEYEFDKNQETKLREGDECVIAADFQPVHLEKLDLDNGRAVLKSTRELPQRCSLIPQEIVDPRVIQASIRRIVQSYLDSGSVPPALESFLKKTPPRLRAHSGGPLIPPGADTLKSAIQVVQRLDESSLCIQGPPGSGKTYTAAHMIAALVQSGKRVAISSNSHKAINLLLSEAAALLPGVSAVKYGGGDGHNDDLPPRIVRLENKDAVAEPAPQLAGGTVFAFSRPGAAGAFDYLFVDEAGQVSAANLTGMAPAARNLVVLGDQMQLSQPVQGVHPGDSGLSVLDYLLPDTPVVADDFGIFLPRTFRLHPRLCEFISGAVYEDRLQPEPGTEERELVIPPRHAGRITRRAGVLFVPVEHEDNVYESEEEAERIAELFDELLTLRVTQRGGGTRNLSAEDILIVAPYNLQVHLLERRIRGARVGTVDRFQGQQAPVVILSMCASTGDSSPRGIPFLFSRNRLNVALSRAETLAIVVANPALARTPCSSVEQMRLVNFFCRALEEGAPAPPARLAGR
jgi:uncharacterized protein